MFSLIKISSLISASRYGSTYAPSGLTHGSRRNSTGRCSDRTGCRCTGCNRVRSRSSLKCPFPGCNRDRKCRLFRAGVVSFAHVFRNLYIFFTLFKHLHRNFRRTDAGEIAPWKFFAAHFGKRAVYHPFQDIFRFMAVFFIFHRLTLRSERLMFLVCNRKTDLIRLVCDRIIICKFPVQRPILFVP